MSNLILALTACAELILTAGISRARLGWTLQECEEHYGQPFGKAEKLDSGKVYYQFHEFHAKGYQIFTYFFNTENGVWIVYHHRNDEPLHEVDVQKLLAVNPAGTGTSKATVNRMANRSRNMGNLFTSFPTQT